MTIAFPLVAALLVVTGCASEQPAPLASLEEVYQSGVAFDEFIADATQRRELWNSNYGGGIVSGEMLDRAKALSAPWRILAVAEDWCSDSVSTIPFLALLAEQVGTVELRIIDSDVGRSIMETFLTPDGRPSTPTVVILDQNYEEVGCWVERPKELQDWALENQEELGSEFGPQKMAWYKEDAGRSTVDEVLRIIEAADRGDRICEAG